MRRLYVNVDVEIDGAGVSCEIDFDLHLAVIEAVRVALVGGEGGGKVVLVLPDGYRVRPVVHSHVREPDQQGVVRKSADAEIM